MKHIRIRIIGSKHPPVKLQIRPNTTVRDVLAYLNLDEDSILYSLSDPTNHFFSSMEALYDYVKNNEKFIASAPGKIDIDEGRREMESLLVVDDEPSPEPIDTTESDEYIRSWFKEEGDAMKCISVEVKGSDTDPVEINITSGLTAGAILTALQLEDYVLCTVPNAYHGFAEADEVFSQVNDRDTLYALTRIAVADNFME